MMNRKEYQNINNETYDVLIVGGGITGAGILSELSSRGYNTVLIEKGDFASGTSSKSAKLVHGGLRYLQYGHFKLVKESLKERDYLLSKYRHIVKPLEFIYPVYSFSLKVKVFLGLMLYKIFSWKSSLSKIKYISRNNTLTKYKGINPRKLQCSFSYFDAVTSDARLCNEIIYNSCNNNNATALNYCELKSVSKNDEYISVLCYDNILKKETTINTKYIVNASGPWIDELNSTFNAQKIKITAPSKGIHIVLSKSKFPYNCSFIFTSITNDKRWIYSVPWENNSVLIGATDTKYDDKIDNVDVNKEDVDYIIKAIQNFVPALNISHSDIISTFSGIRPLLKNENVSSKDLSREYKIWWLDNRILNVFGGKLTGFRTMANISANMLDAKSKKTRNNKSVLDINYKNNKNDNFSKHIIKKYLYESERLFSICEENADAKNKLHQDLDIYIVEVIYFIRYQSCYFLSDVLTRRLSVSYIISSLTNKDEIINTVATVLKQENNLSDEEIKNDIFVYKNNLLK